jgi:signal peptide peptidase SppA
MNPNRNYFRVLSALRNQPWAITPRALETMNDILEKPVADLEAVIAKRGEPFENAGGKMERRGPVALLSVEGPIFRYANLMTEVSGATSVQMLALAFNEALEDPDVEQIMLYINSPGGEVDGINSFADQVRAGTEVKPVTAFIDGLGASAAYWIAAASSRIIADEGSQIGSIGVVATYTDRTGAQEKQGVKTYQIVSSQTPRKRPDPGTDEGRAQLQEMVDSMADLFISRIATFRGINPEKVTSDFGGGRVFGAKAALNAGMIDRISSFEPYIRSLDGPVTVPSVSVAPEYIPVRMSLEGETMPPNNSVNTVTLSTATALPDTGAPVIAGTPVIAAPLTPNPQVIQRERIRAILALPEAKGLEEQAQQIALDTDLDVETSRKILAAGHVAEPTPAPAQGSTSFERLMARVPNPNVGTGPTEDDSPQAEAARVLAFVPNQRKAS